MCGRLVQIDPARAVKEFSITGVPPRLSARFNVAPADPVLVVRRDATNSSRLDWLTWGLVPGWTKHLAGRPLINARVETLAEKPAFRDALRLRRGVAVAEGFFEWERRGRLRQPHYVTQADGGLLALAALWEAWRTPAGDWLETFAIVTKPAVDPVARIHDRMPAVLGEEQRAVWIDTATRDPDLLTALARAPSPELRMAPVDPRVNRVGHDGPDCIQEIALQRGLF